MRSTLNAILMVGMMAVSPAKAVADDFRCFRDACVGANINTLGPNWTKNTEIFRDKCINNNASRYDLAVESPYTEVYLSYDEKLEEITTINIKREIAGNGRTISEANADLRKYYGFPENIILLSPSVEMHVYNKEELQNIYTIIGNCRKEKEEQRCYMEKKQYYLKMHNTKRNVEVLKASEEQRKRCEMDLEIK